MAQTFTPWPGSEEQETEQQAGYYPGPLPSPDPQAMGALRDSLYQEAERLLPTDPRFAGILPGPTSPTQGTGTPTTQPTEQGGEFYAWPEEVQQAPDDYGWGISNAFKRGLIRTGQLIDLAQQDWEEYAEGEKALEQYGLSKEDEARMQELHKKEGFWQSLGYYVTNPALAMQVVAESLPQSTATLVGGAAGALTAGPVGAAVGAGTGSFVTEYMASLSEAFSEAGVDATDPKALKAAYANDEIMDNAREIAAKRGLGVATFDAISMGLAGRIYKPAKALTGAAREGAGTARTLAGRTLGGTSEILAQSTAGALGERSAQVLAGQEYDPAAVAGEFIGEVVPGLGEIAIGTAARRGRAPDETGEPGAPGAPTPPGALPTEPTEDVSESIAKEAESYEVPTEGTSQAEKQALEDALDKQDAAEQPQEQLDLGIPPSPPEPAAPAAPTSAPESEQATTPPETTEPTAPVTPAAEPIATEDEVVTADDLVTQPTPTEEAPTEAAPIETPMIQAKEVEAGFRELTKKTKGSLPGIRKAMKALGEAINARYPDTKLPSLQRTFGAKAIGKYFQTLDEEVFIGEDLPNLKEFLRAVVDSPDAATAVQNLTRLTDYVNSSQQVLEGAAQAQPGSVLSQANEQVARFDAYERERGSKVNKKTGKPTARKGFGLADRAEQIDELATAVEALGERASKLGVTDVDTEGLGSLIRRARSYRENVATARKRVLKGGTGAATKAYKFTGKNLDEVGTKLRELATKLAPAVAKAEETAPKTQALPEKRKGKAKPEAKKPVTEAPAKPKKAEAAKKVSKAKAEKKAAPEKPYKPTNFELEQILKNELAISRLSKPGKMNEQTKKLIAAKKKLIEDIKSGKAAKKQQEIIEKKRAEKKAQPDALKSYNELRRRAKELGVKATGKREELEARVAEAEQQRGEKQVPVTVKKPKSKPKPKPKPKKVAKPDEVIEIVPKPTRGKQSLGVAEEMGFPSGTTLTEALAESGISKESANIVRGLLETVSKAGRDKIRTALVEYDGTAEGDLKFIATLAEVMGGQVADNDMMAILDFARGNYENRVQLKREEPSGKDDYLAEVAEEADMSVEDVQFLEGELGYGGSAMFPDRGEEVETAFSEDTYEELNFIETSDIAPVIKGNITSGKELNQALFAKGFKLLGWLYDNSNSTAEIDAGKPRNELKRVQVRELLDQILDVLPTNNRYYQLAKRLRELNSKVPVYLQDAPITYGKEDLQLAEDEQVKRTMGVWNDGRNSGGVEFGYIRLVFDQTTAENDPRQFFHHALHEIIHAATTVAYDTDPEFRSEIDSLLDQTRDFMEKEYPNYQQELEENAAAANTFYGITNGKEFIAEAMTNERFQKYLSKIPSINTRRRTVSNMLREFYDAIKRFLGYSVRNTVLDDVLTLVDANLYTDAQNFNASQKMSWQNRRAKREAAAIVQSSGPKRPKTKRVRAREQVLDSTKNLKVGVKESGKSIADTLKGMGRKTNLAFSNRDVIERNYRKLFDKISEALGIDFNPLTTYTKAKNSASQLVRKFERKAYLMLKKFQAVSSVDRAQIQMHMADITKANIDPTKSLRDPANDHIWTKPNKKGVRKIRKRFKDIAPKARDNFVKFQKSNPEAAALVEEMAALTKEIHETKISAALQALGEAFKLDSKEIATLKQARTFETIDKMFPKEELEQAKYDKENNLFAKGKTDVEGKKLLKEQLAEAEARAEVAKSAKTILRESSIKGWYFPLRRYGEFVVSTGEDVTDRDEKYVSFHSSRKEAERVAAAINATADEDQKVYVSKKISAGATARDVAVVFKELKSRIKDDATRNRLKGALSEIMAANAAYASQLKRADIDGVAADDMARAFEEYVHVSKYTIGDLLTAHKVSESLTQLKNMVKNANEVTSDLDEVERIGDVVAEIDKQNMAESEDREMSTFQKVVGITGFLNFLGAPSYWVLNATQTYTVTLPYVTAKFGIKGPTRLAAAQKTVTGAVARALNSKDKSYEGFKAQLPEEARKVVEALETENVIQSTIAHEFGDMLSPSYWQRMLKSMPPVAKTANLTMQVLEKVPEAVEHFNRISTALAIYELSDGDIQATIDGVQATQFNYDTANRARLLKKLPLPLGQGGRGIVTPVMMFKTYGVGIMRLLYGSMIDSIKGETKQERAQARKLAAGLMVSHTLFGGVAGGLMLGPIQAIQGAINMALEPDDEWDIEQATEEFMAEIAGDFAATMARRGIPAAVFNVDMSNSINLGNLLWMSNDRLDPTEYGDIEKAIFKGLGPVAQYGVTAYREGARLLTGDVRGGFADFLEAAIPLKAYRGVSQSLRYGFGEGLATDAGLQMIKPEDYNSMLASALGFQPTQKTEIQQAYYDDQLLEQKRSKRKGQLIKRANNAIMSGDQRAVAAVFDDITSYNLSVPEAKYRITPGDMAKLRSRQRTSQREFDRRYVYPNQ